MVVIGAVVSQCFAAAAHLMPLAATVVMTLTMVPLAAGQCELDEAFSGMATHARFLSNGHVNLHQACPALRFPA
jgi:hypothetical protein